VIRSYRDRETQELAEGRESRRLPGDIQRRAKMRLDRLAAAVGLDDLRVPPSHRLEALKGNRAGQHSIRINDQWRVCFVWRDGHAWDVEIVDYH
jgi:proteic killer suppression protein